MRGAGGKIRAPRTRLQVDSLEAIPKFEASAPHSLTLSE